MPEWGTALIIVAVVIVVFLLMGYIKAPPDTAYIITGLGKRRILIGKAGIRLPFIERLDKIIESLYEDKVEGKISEERYLKMSDTYETEQAGLKERVKTLKSEIAKAKEDDDKILDFMMLIYKYNSFEELTPEILRAFIEKVVVHEKTKVDGHYRQTVEIFYNFVGAIDRPIWGNELSDDDD